MTLIDLETKQPLNGATLVSLKYVLVAGCTGDFYYSDYICLIEKHIEKLCP